MHLTIAAGGEVAEEHVSVAATASELVGNELSTYPGLEVGVLSRLLFQIFGSKSNRHVVCSNAHM